MSISKSKFPDTYSKVPLEQLLRTYKEGFDRLQKSIVGLEESDLKKRVIKDKWSIFEILLHVVDSEIVGAVRIRQCFSQSDTLFPFYNQDIWAEEFRYQEQDNGNLEDVLMLFNYLRKTTYRIFLRCTDEDWKKRGIHPENGPMTLRNLLELYADHTERHIDQILERRAILGKSLKLPLLLKERLY